MKAEMWLASTIGVGGETLRARKQNLFPITQFFNDYQIKRLFDEVIGYYPVFRY